MQQASLWKDGRLVLTSPISTGRDGYPTPMGRFVITDKQRLRNSSIYKVPMPYFMRLSCSEVGMHAGVVPNYPASHGCIRMPESAAIKFYHAVDEGTLVSIGP
jgi:lipoprotein-anchoring transpeptidase ErfK/SrfK